MSRISRVVLALLVFVGALASWPANAQQQPGGPGGILIDAEGVLRSAQPTGQLRKTRPSKVSVKPTQRIVSLRRLEEACRDARCAVADLPPDLQSLGGLTAIDEIVLAPDEQDVFLIGPGEDPAADGSDPGIGAATGRPLIRMEDWVVVLRAIRRGEGVITCSIDPDPDRLRQYNQQIKDTIQQVNFGNADRWYGQLATILGRQNVTVGGVPNDSRAALILAAADYSMKRIALGTETSGVKDVKSQLAFAGSDRGSTMQRWWFATLYDPLQVDADRTRFVLSGPRVQLCAQEELIQPDGQRTNASQTKLSSQKFAQNFTEHYADVARVRPVFAELQGLFDVAVTATILSRERLPDRAGWTLSVWSDEEAFPTPRHVAPQFVESSSMTRRVNSRTMVGLVGGVTLSPGDVVRREQALTADGNPLSARAPTDSATQFRWDVQD